MPTSSELSVTVLRLVVKQMTLEQCSSDLIKYRTQHADLDQAHQNIRAEYSTALRAATPRAEHARTAHQAHGTENKHNIDPLLDAYGEEQEANAALDAAKANLDEISVLATTVIQIADNPPSGNDATRIGFMLQLATDDRVVAEATVKRAKHRLDFELFKVRDIADEGADLMLEVERAEKELKALLEEAFRKESEAEIKVEQASARIEVIVERMEELSETARGGMACSDLSKGWDVCSRF